MPQWIRCLLLGVWCAGYAGAPARGGEFAIRPEARAHWAFQPVREVAVPPAGDTEGNGIDAFLLRRLRAAGLERSAEAPREKLIRRAAFDLTGLPPAPEEIDAFVADRSPDAYEKLLDRLLDSPRYGERWGRHWLDLARYAETDGFEHDTVRPHSWRYRDYVIRSFNQDKPYDRFVREQIAGDELWPGDPEALIATGFNLLGPDMVDSSDQAQRRHITLNDMTDTAGLAFLGLTIGCARCHDHKFDPVSQEDYYSFQAFFGSGRFNRERSIPSGEERAEHERRMEEYRRHPSLRALEALEAPARAELYERKLAKLSPEAQAAHRTPAGRRGAEQSNLVLETLDKVVIPEAELEAALSPDARRERHALLGEVKRVPKPAPLPQAMALETGPDAKTFVLHRGEYTEPREQVSARWPEILGGGPGHGQRRADLADWLASAENPLTARVMVNRIWKQHFGRGLVETASDFGTRGQAPSHPDLLDWLAGEFVRGGWSIKRMHRLIMRSVAYRQSSETRSEAAARSDPENRLYWRMNRLRLEGEAIRDSLLAIGGRLDPKQGGPGVMPPLPAELFAGAAGWKAGPNGAGEGRRSVYIFARRNLRFPFLEAFDAPDSNLSCSGRERSTTAPQALTLLNSDEVLRAARATAAAIEAAERGTGPRVELAYRLALGRKPDSREAPLARGFLAHSPLEELCRALFNLNEFVYVE